MPISMRCPSCNKTLSAPDSAAGKKAKCPTCATLMVVPEVIHNAEPGGIPDAPPPPLPPEYNMLDDILGTGPAAEPQQGSGAGGAPRRPCPMCGEEIVASAAQCRFCGAVFAGNPAFRGSVLSRRGQSYLGFSITSMVVGIVGIFTVFTCFVPLLFGILAAIFGGVALNGMGRSRNYDGKGMAIAGLVLGIIDFAIGILWVLLFAAASTVPHFR